MTTIHRTDYRSRATQLFTVHDNNLTPVKLRIEEEFVLNAYMIHCLRSTVLHTKVTRNPSRRKGKRATAVRV